jgi:hypothetical protein
MQVINRKVENEMSEMKQGGSQTAGPGGPCHPQLLLQ